MAGSRGGARAGAGRPSGAQNKLTKAEKQTLTQMASEYTADALATLAEIMQGAQYPAAARVSAANSILDRAHGKPVGAEREEDPDAPPVSWTISVRPALGQVRVTQPE